MARQNVYDGQVAKRAITHVLLGSDKVESEETTHGLIKIHHVDPFQIHPVGEKARLPPAIF